MLSRNSIKIKLFIVFILVMLIGVQYAFAQSLSLPDIDKYGGLVQDPGEITSFESGLAMLIVGVVMNIRYVLTALTIGLLIYSGYLMVIKQGSEQAWTDAKSLMIWGIIGLGIVGLAGEFVRMFAVGQCAELGLLPSSNNVGCQAGGFLKDGAAMVRSTSLFREWVGYVIKFLKYIAGAAAVAMLMKNALRMASNNAGEELEKDKKNLYATVQGLIILIIAEPIINNVLFVVDTSRYPTTGGVEAGIDYVQGISEVQGITNFLVTLITPLAILMIVIAGIMYMTAGANTENQAKAKRIVITALVAMIIIYGAFGIVNSIISGQFDPDAPNTNPAAAVEASIGNSTVKINSE